jgi:hypothetical protein
MMQLFVQQLVRSAPIGADCTARSDEKLLFRPSQAEGNHLSVADCQSAGWSFTGVQILPGPPSLTRSVVRADA